MSPSSSGSASSLASAAEAYRRSRSKGTPIAYRVIHTLFRFVLSVFFSHILVEHVDRVPTDGEPALLLANHSNSLTDALVVMASVPFGRRRMLRMTAKATHFRRGTFSSWLIEKAGSVPLMRAKDYEGEDRKKVDNRAVLELLNGALLDDGDCVAMFPEGISRYHPTLAPLKTGAARICADVLAKAQARGDDEFRLHVVTCSITYLHRQSFRSDVLVTYHPALVLTVADYPALAAGDRAAVTGLTARLSERIRSGTLDAPSWSLIRAAHTARRLYAPLGTHLSLGDHVRLTQRFVDAFAGKRAAERWGNGLGGLETPMAKHEDGGEAYFGRVDAGMASEEVDELVRELNAYQTLLAENGLKDDRVRNNRLLHRSVILKRLAVRIFGAVLLFAISLPGLCLWGPVFFVTHRAAEKQKRKGPAWDTWDEITQTKLLYGLATGFAVYICCIAITLPMIAVTLWGIPLLMWLTLRWCEDLVSSLRAALALSKMLWLGPRSLGKLRERRADLAGRVLRVATELCGLPADARVLSSGRRTGPRLGYFSVRRRRKKDYQEVMKLWDYTEYPSDEGP